MPVGLSSALQMARRALESNQGWLWFLRITFADGTQARLVRASTHRVLGGVTWQRCDFDADLSAQSPDSSQSLRFTLTNVQRIASAFVVAGKMKGARVLLLLAHESETTLDLSRGFEFLVVRSSPGTKRIEFECGVNPDLIQTPGRSYSRDEFPQLLPTAGVRRGW